jgi:quercetin dioxygenase-like cupin family protein
MLESRLMRNRLAFCIILLVAFTVTAQTPPEVEITAEPGHHPALENKYVRVFKVEVAPHAATLMHRHRHDYIYVTLGAAHVENDVAGKPAVTITLQDGETHVLPGGFAHIAKNLSDQPFRNITIELLQDEKARQSSPPKWDEERGLHILNGGTLDILFVKDGARASELQLQPGGVLPKHHHPGPYLVVAVTDLDLRSDIEGTTPSQLRLKAGDVAWEKGSLTHALTNIGRQNAKLITVEFQ